MSLVSGTRLGRYEIRSKLGEGGMGEVYRARDEKLNRDVAIKVLPAELSQNVDRLNRFEQEAQAAGALNHPNILSVYDVGLHEGAPYIVAELLEGEELREALSGGALTSRKAVDYAQQIADGLAAAHDKGIVHRDLKPENIFVCKDGRVKILDFGLAKLRAPQGDVVSSEVATRKQITDPGTVMGTAGYMSPEQVRGHAIDHRSDIFSFGAVLYEMLCGKHAFRRETMAETMTAILKEDPPEVSTINPTINLPLERIVRRCLEKQPERRFQTASDLAFALESLSGSTQSFSSMRAATSSIHERRPWPLRYLIAAVAGVALLVGVIVIAAIYARRKTNQAAAVRFTVAIPDEAYPVADVEEHNLAVAPDGKQIAFVAYLKGQRTIWLRPLDALSAQILPGTEGAFSIFWSPDSHSLGFFAEGKLKRIDVSTKAVQIICNLPVIQTDECGAWGSAGTIIFSQDIDGKIYRVPAVGGTPALVSAQQTGNARRWIEFLPDGKRFIFYEYDNDHQKRGVSAGAIDSAEIKLVVQMSPAHAQYVNGYLLYPREGSLLAQPFDEKTLRMTGEPTVIVDQLPYFDKSGWCEFSASDTGVLAYMTEIPQKRIVWLDRTGREISQTGEPADIAHMRLAPDGQRVALDIVDPRSSSGGDVWIQDLQRGTRTRLVSGPADDTDPVWSPDGQRIAYFSCCEDPSSLHIKDISGSGKGETPIKDPSFITPLDWVSDGRFILYRNAGDLWVLPLMGDAKPYPLMQTESFEDSGAFSPDGHWVAFGSNETGRNEIYVTSFEHPGEKWRISTDGGFNPRWRHDGRELFFLSADNQLMSVEIKPGAAFASGTPAALFKTDPLTSDYDTAADGQRFAFVVSAPGVQRLPFAVDTDWTRDLKK
jgi:eukaryotic-like serine/threonine-protein kinase